MYGVRSSSRLITFSSSCAWTLEQARPDQVGPDLTHGLHVRNYLSIEPFILITFSVILLLLGYLTLIRIHSLTSLISSLCFISVFPPLVTL